MLEDDFEEPFDLADEIVLPGVAPIVVLPADVVPVGVVLVNAVLVEMDRSFDSSDDKGVFAVLLIVVRSV